MRVGREGDYLIDELDCADQYRAECDDYLRGRGPGARLERISTEDRFEVESVLDVRVGGALEAEHHDRIASVYDQEWAGEEMANGGAHMDCRGDYETQENRNEKREVAARVFANDLERYPATTLPKRDRRDAHHEQRDRREHQGCSNDRAEADRSVRGRRIATGEQGDRRHERLRPGGSDRPEQAPDRCLGDAQPMTPPFDAVGEKFRPGEDYREAKREN